MNTWKPDYSNISINKVRNPASSSPDSQPLKLPCVIHPHIKSLCMWVEARAICRCLITSEADGAVQCRSRECLPHLGQYYQIKTGERYRRPGITGWCFKSAGSSDEERRASYETVSRARKCLVCLKVSVLRQTSVQLITGSPHPPKKTKKLQILVQLWTFPWVKNCYFYINLMITW